MKNLLIGLALSVLGVAMVVPEADAKRVGGARSSGTQRSTASTPPASAPASGQTSQMNQTQQAAPAGTPASAAAAPASGLSRWAPMLGGLAIGGLLGSMFGSGGLGAIGGMLMAALMIGLLVFAGVFLFRMLSQKRGEATQQPLQYAGAGAQTAAPPPSQLSGFDAGAAAAAHAAPAGVRAPSVPAGFDVAAFVKGAKLNFIRLQAANDNGNAEEIREFTTPDMFEALRQDIEGRAGAKQHTDVVALDAELLEVVTEGDMHWASVRFTGSIRETPGAEPENFIEVWNLQKPVSGATGWVLAGIQQMH
jgi:predicted lipid-binding transport protein (Tim44 family)